MKRIIILIMAMGAVICSCTKKTSSSTGKSQSEYVDAFVQVYYPNATETTWGGYVLEEKEGDGLAVSDSTYVLVSYTQTYLDGTITKTTSEKLSKQLGTYKKTNYYGPVWWTRGDGTSFTYLSAGVEEAIRGMKVGGYKKFIVPSWLSTTSRYNTKDEYLANSTSTTNYIYELTVEEVVNNITKWEKDSLARYIAANYPEAALDSLGGFYFLTTKRSTDTTELSSSTTVYADYICRRLDNIAVDASIADTAKCYGFYDSDETYSAQLVNIDDDDYTSTTISSSSSSVIDGFAYAFTKLHFGEGASVFFTSTWGYGSSGNGDEIPAYCPLRFDISVKDDE